MKKFKNYSAQSIIEYSAITALVVAGILTMGPHVIRSINAYFKSAEEQAKDSVREKIRQADIWEDFDLGPDCQCMPGPFLCGDDRRCYLNEEMRELRCTPSTCLTEYADGHLPLYQCFDERLLSAKGRKAFLDEEYCFPNCRLDIVCHNYDDPGCQLDALSSCPRADDETQLPSSVFKDPDSGKGCGWECCLPARLVSPLICGTTHTGDDTKGSALYLRECGRNRDEQYFWAPNDLCGGFCQQKSDYANDWCSPVERTAYVPSPEYPVTYVMDQWCNSPTHGCVSSPGLPCMCEAECNKSFCPSNSGSRIGCNCARGWEKVPIESNGCPEGWKTRSGTIGTCVDLDDPSAVWSRVCGN